MTKFCIVINDKKSISTFTEEEAMEFAEYIKKTYGEDLDVKYEICEEENEKDTI